MASSPVDVSVVVPTFRREKLVVEAVASALAQKGVALDVLVLDDSPEGSARDVIAAIGDPRVQYVKRDTPSGGRPAVPRNEGLLRARGRFVHFLDDDDRLADGALRALLEPLQRSGAGVSFGVVEAFGDDAGAVAKERRHFQRSAAFARASDDSRFLLTREGLFGPAPIICSSCLFRRQAALEVGGFDPRIAVYEDVELFVRAARAHGAVFVDHPVLHRRTGLPSLSRDAQAELTRASYREIHASYRRRFGAVEFYALKLTAKVAARVMPIAAARPQRDPGERPRG